MFYKESMKEIDKCGKEYGKYAEKSPLNSF